MITRYIKENIIKTELRFIGHGCNCSNTMGSGVAKALYTAFPQVKNAYHAFSGQFQYRAKNELLGEIQSVRCGDKIVYNCFTQLNFGYDGKRYLNYPALVDCFKSLTEELKGEIIAIPKIGSDRAGGNWNFISEIINDITQDKLEVWVYVLE